MLESKIVYGASQKIEQCKKIIQLLPLVDDPEIIKRASKLVLEASEVYATAQDHKTNKALGMAL